MIHCGITMVRPITELARQFEQHEKVKVTIAQGGSEDLYQSAKKAASIFIFRRTLPPRSSPGRADCSVTIKLVGYNQMALFVAKGNPKGQIRSSTKSSARIST